MFSIISIFSLVHAINSLIRNWKLFSYNSNSLFTLYIRMFAITAKRTTMFIWLRNYIKEYSKR